ncbi:MAG: WecB/TagA/CpsF family glycosyltransferase [Deltaproteobacteria bacterium]|nr:WecB/TagA/CpsF family glycosyltransferase [Deltaproteobacteria bacterium]MBI4223340.1 WecB/TagA/CpsF family glycosyltransferase [Deltaproteobacteria bacterium]
MTQTLDWIENAVQKRSPFCRHTVVNAAKIVLAQRDPLLKQSIRESDLINIDGQPVVWAARLLGIPVPEKVSGSDLIVALLKSAEQKGWRVFFLGGTRNVLEQMSRRLQQRHPGLILAGKRDGYFPEEEAASVASQIRESKADILFVGMPTPKKEIFLSRFREVMQVPFSMGVGGSFDILAGKTKRAPRWLQQTGLEWFFRMAQEPRRLFKRYWQTNRRFVYMVFKEYLHQKRKK